MASVLQIEWLRGHSSSLALPSLPRNCCPAVPDLGHIEHPLQRFCVDLAVLFHLICWHGLLAIHVYRISAVLAQNTVIIDPIC